jgi:hypothetical protein
MLSVPGKQRALIIANSYQDSISVKNKIRQLPSCLEDASILNKIFKELTFHRITVKNDVSSKKYLEKLFKNSQKDDLLFIHFSGHGETGGIVKKGQLRMISSWLNPDLSLFTGLELQDMIEKTQCQNIIISSDCCYAGRMFKDYTTDKNLIYICSSSGITRATSWNIDGGKRSGSLSLVYDYIFKKDSNPTFDRFQELAKDFIQKYGTGSNKILITKI